ncbi:hypothetical protein VIBHAR_05625 [Vibrio campbellii ATCC BAA-1116]|uniref:Uncharacterized protein n=1 Tax=Vibrio campbellii (strain ATCC BAA-1116) TaxID=2902295 RepID=A7N8B5_VIBC1|nr:hypothetical protein VIBHAR_05625 [Vibrio campbellii ATCC BAA-1116]
MIGFITVDDVEGLRNVHKKSDKQGLSDFYIQVGSFN